MALDNVTSHFSTLLEPIASASFLSSLSIIHGITQSYNTFYVSLWENFSSLMLWIALKNVYGLTSAVRTKDHVFF